jgi:hypothetical protein
VISSAACELTILMPCLDEAETIGLCIAKAHRFLDRSGIRGEIVIADNGSQDGSQAIARRLGARVVDVAERGYGAALIGGIAAARGTYVIMGDSDDSYDFAALDPFVAKLRAGYALVMGNRFKGGIAKGAMPPLHRYLGNPVLSAVGRVFFHSPCRDFHCGLRGFRRDAIQGLDLQAQGMEFASEMVVKATLAGLPIAEVPTTLSPDGRGRAPHLKSWRDGWRHLRFLLLFSPRWLFVYPGLALLLTGLTAMAWLLPETRHIGRVAFDVHTLFYASLSVVVGSQSVLFGVFAKIYAAREGFAPQNPYLGAGLARFSLEAGVVCGVLLMLAGVGLALYALGSWDAGHFGPLSATAAMRLVIPSGTMILLGSQLVCGSFIIGVLDIRAAAKHEAAAPPPVRARAA